MNLNNLPPKAQLMGWSPKTLADYMKRLNLSGCDRVVMKSNISGAKFMYMNESELQAFPSCYIPIITKIQSEINKVELKKPLIPRFKPQLKPNQAIKQEEEHWEPDEFGCDQDTESDNDYECPTEEDGEGRYICALNDAQIAEAEDDDNAEIYEESHAMPMPPPGPLAEENKPPRHPRVPAQAQRETPPAAQPIISPDRSMKHGAPAPAPRDLKSKDGSVVKPARKSIGIFPSMRAQKPTGHSNKVSQPAIPATEHAKVNNPQQGQKQGLHPSWYGGKVTRHQAEDALREIDKDGAFVVRDSSAGSSEHPYTLMLLKAHKVYNIRIRKEDNYFILGNGFKNSKCFPGVKEMISHHTHTPLQLVDATAQSTEELIQCCLLYPVLL